MTIALTALGGASRQSLAASRTALDNVLKSSSTADVLKLAKDLFTVVAVLDSSTLLRRSLTDGSRDASSKTNLVGELLENQLPHRPSS